MNRRTRRSRAAMMVTVPVVLAVGRSWAVDAARGAGALIEVLSLQRHMPVGGATSNRHTEVKTMHGWGQIEPSPRARSD